MHRRGGALSVDREFVRALENEGWGGTSAQRQGVRKTNQFCRQVQRALNLALADLLVKVIRVLRPRLNYKGV
jgi:hypothetical protein